MAIQLEDKKTLSFLPEIKKRGRPLTGKALTPAEKQAAYRKRKLESGFRSIELSDLERNLLISILNDCSNLDSHSILDKLI